MAKPYKEEEFKQTLQNPAIIHFATATKPWRSIYDYSKPHCWLLPLVSVVRQAKGRSHAAVPMLLNPWTVFAVPPVAARDRVALWLIR